MDIKKDDLLINPPKQFRPISLWAWNTRLYKEETARQIAQMDEAGTGGVVIHARGGLRTGYMGHEWMENIRMAVAACQRRGMAIWCYDEYGKPSGNAAGSVSGMGEKYQQKYLRCSITPLKQGVKPIASIPVHGRLYYFYYEVNENYVDFLEPKVTEAFLRSVHQQYKRRLGSYIESLAGFFTDEPQISSGGYPWTPSLPAEYQKQYEESLLEKLPDLFFHSETAYRTRIRFWRLITELFAKRYTKQVAGWCHENGLQLTGHLAYEKTMTGQLTANGTCMPQYACFDIPGIDWPGRRVSDCLTVLQAASVAHQLGKRQILSESFAMCGWNVSFEELRRIAEYQMVHGVTLLCQHLAPYSLGGIRKRDAPAALFVQQPWWKEYRHFNDFISRVGMLLTLGNVHFSVLVLHPQQSAWALYDGSETSRAEIDRLNSALRSTVQTLEHAQIPFHLGDDQMLSQHASIEGNRLCVGAQRYRAVIISPCLSLDARVAALLAQFAQNGGTILCAEAEEPKAQAAVGIPYLSDGVSCANLRRLAGGFLRVPLHQIAQALPSGCRPFSLKRPDGSPAVGIAATVRDFDREGVRMCYFVNLQAHATPLTIRVKGAAAVRFDPSTGKRSPVPSVQEEGTLCFSIMLEPHGSAIFFVFEKLHPSLARRKKAAASAPLASIRPCLSPTWEILRSDLNAITLDRCDCSFNGVHVEKNIPAIEITERACMLGQPVELRLTYRFQISQSLDGPFFLVCEPPKNFRFTINGHLARQTPRGFYRDPAFEKLNITKWIQLGENELCMETCFQQYDSVYRNFQAAKCGFEAIRNRLTYEEEIEAVYLLGHFRVDTPGDFQPGRREDSLYQGHFSLVRPSPIVYAGDLAKQGFPFFSGQITLRNTFRLTQEECVGRCLRFAKRGATVLAVRVNGKPAGKLFWQPYEIDLSRFLLEGENTIEITLTGSLRNLLGPHHLKHGESYSVSPGSFYRRSSVWRGEDNPDWTDDYSFVEFGIFLV